MNHPRIQMKKKPKNEEVETITILLFGRVGSGRTTLANIILIRIVIGDRRSTLQEI